MGMTEELSLEDRYRSAILLRDVMELLLLDKVRTDEILKRNHAPDLDALDALATTIKQNLFKCAASIEWISGVIEMNPRSLQDWVTDQPQWRLLKPNHRPKLEIFADHKRLTDWIRQIPGQVSIEVRDLDSQMKQMRSDQQTDGDVSKKAGCLLSGLCVVLAFATLNPFVGFGAGVGLGYCLS